MLWDENLPDFLFIGDTSNRILSKPIFGKSLSSCVLGNRKTLAGGPLQSVDDLENTPIDELTETLLELLKCEVDEGRIIDQGGAILSALRRRWAGERNSFTEVQILRLKTAAQQLSALREFVILQEDFPDLKTRESVDEVISQLYSTLEALEGLAVAGRVHKEIRQLLEHQTSLPSDSQVQKSAELSKAISRLSTSAPECKKCGARMAIREGKGTFFWGCSQFPECWARRWFTKQERDSLPD